VHRILRESFDILLVFLGKTLLAKAAVRPSKYDDLIFVLGIQRYANSGPGRYHQAKTSLPRSVASVDCEQSNDAEAKTGCGAHDEPIPEGINPALPDL
jgi:hypothetical protein